MRLISDTEGYVYIVRLAPHEHPGNLGVHPDINALCFETILGRWIGSVTVVSDFTLDDFSLRELRHLLRVASGGHTSGRSPPREEGA